MAQFFTGHLNFQAEGVGEARGGRVCARGRGIAGHDQGHKGLRRGAFEGFGTADDGTRAGAQREQIADGLEVRRPSLGQQPRHVEGVGLEGALEDGRLPCSLLKISPFAGDPRTAPAPFSVPVHVRRAIGTCKNPDQRCGIGAFAGDDTRADGPQD